MAPAAIPAVGLLAGSALGLLLPGIAPIATPLLIVAAVAAAWSWRADQTRLLRLAIAVGFGCGGSLLAEDAWREAWRPTLRLAFEDAVRAERGGVEEAPRSETVLAVVTGVLRADAVVRPGGVAMSLDVTSVSFPTASLNGARQTTTVDGGVLVTIGGELARSYLAEWYAGRTIRAPVLLRRPTRYLNPGVADDERGLARRGGTLVGTVKSGALVDVVREAPSVHRAAWRTRSFARRTIAAAVGRWSPQSAAIVTAIVIGDRTGLDDEVERRLQEAGTYHVIAISGGNIAILAGFMLAAFRLAGVLGPAAMLTAIAGLLAYAWIVVGSVSVTRATAMAIVYFAARAIDLRAHALNALAFVAAMLVAAAPLSIADPGFLLTFGATAAILTVVPEMGTVSSAPRLLAWLAAILVASLAVEAALMPIAALFFSRVTFAGLILNVAAIPLMAVAQLAGMIAVAAALVSAPAASAAGWVAHVGAEGLVQSSGLVRWMPLLTWRVAPPHWGAVAVYYTTLLIAWAVWRNAASSGSSGRGRRLRVAGIAAVAASGAAIWILFEPVRLVTAHGDGRLHVTFMDVGQGDAALVRFPRGQTLLVDAGGASGSGSFDIGDRVVGAVLRHAGIRRLDTAALTHGDADHIGGLPSIIREFRPRELWEGVPVPPSDALAALRARATSDGARWTNLQSGNRVSIDDVDVIVRHPPPADWERQGVRNDDSIVLELLWRDVSIVLTGDIGHETEQAIAPLFPSAGIRVLKVPHHGSRTSSSEFFLHALAPRLAIVSAGRNNTFGHPAPDVLRRYERIGAQLFRTDRDGAIELTTDGYSVSVESFAGRRVVVR